MLPKRTGILPVVPTELPCPGQLNSGSQGSWGVSVNITLVVTLAQKTSFGVVCGEKFQAPAMQGRPVCVILTQTALKMGSGGLL